ncbi:hypothetical protein EIP86_001721 [Pleurotus ostreatoroseus]|nr:hypothetical protein EIP86_001721 [Pleurotus ostreatoroseus]
MAQIQHAAYSSGHDAAVLRTHAWRTVDNSAPYVKDFLKPDMKILDVGCGPGSITVDLATYVPNGHVTGVENVEAPLEAARAQALERGVKNADFMVGDALALPFPDASFDITHAHQVLQHTGDPVRMLREMRRVTKPGGFVACREADHGSFVWYPVSQGMSDWLELSTRVARADGREPHAGRQLHVWAREAGFDPAQMTTSVGTWCFRTKEEREYWGGAWKNRVLSGSFATSALSKGFATQEDLERMSQAWKDWVACDDGWFGVLHGQMP